jgi:hypothetical protein
VSGASCPGDRQRSAKGTTMEIITKAIDLARLRDGRAPVGDMVKAVDVKGHHGY